jgi:hypothetical protein
VLAEAQRIDGVTDIESVSAERRQIVHVHVRVLKALARREVEVTGHFVHLQIAEQTAPIAALQLKHYVLCRFAGRHALLTSHHRHSECTQPLDVWCVTTSKR